MTPTIAPIFSLEDSPPGYLTYHLPSSDVPSVELTIFCHFDLPLWLETSTREALSVFHRGGLLECSAGHGGVLEVVRTGEELRLRIVLGPLRTKTYLFSHRDLAGSLLCWILQR